MTARKTPVPASQREGPPSGQTVDALQRHLHVVEEDTSKMLGQLAEMGFVRTEPSSGTKNQDGSGGPGVVSPYKPRIAGKLKYDMYSQPGTARLLF